MAPSLDHKGSLQTIDQMALVQKTILLFLFSISFACAQTVDRIVQGIVAINELQYERVGFAAEKSDNYQNFERLKQIADTETLLDLLEHSNPVVSCYASWALIDQKYSNLPSVFARYLQKPEALMTFSGCIKSEDRLPSEFYHRYWNKTADKARDRILFQLDSMILQQDQPDWLLLLRALENRVYPKQFHKEIERLAFEEGFIEAIFYFSNWYKAEYRDQIRSRLTLYLKETDFSKPGISTYYAVVSELLSFRDETLNQVLIEKLKQDKHWQLEREKFDYLLQQYSIYILD